MPLRDFRASLKRNNAAIAYDHAARPGFARGVARQFAERPADYDRAQVEAEFGPAAAEAWQQVVEARRAFFEAARPQRADGVAAPDAACDDCGRPAMAGRRHCRDCDRAWGMAGY